ncbi:MAG: hypothetical protein WD096_09940 [Actinomycetota bacterium]
MTSTREGLETLRAELEQIQRKSTKTVEDLHRASEVVEEVAELGRKSARDRRRRDRAAMQRTHAQLGTVSEYAGEATTATLGDALKQAGFHPGGPPVEVASAIALAERKEATIDGGTDVEATLPRRFFAAPLGLESRYLYPSLRSETVEFGTTGVVSFRQKSRTLADPALMVRDILDVTQKPETDSSTEVVTAPLHQIANVESGTPNVLLANDRIALWVNADLVAAYRSAVDGHIVGQITAELIHAGGGGENAFESVLYAQETVRSNGYSPDLVVMSPADGLALQLLQLSGGDSYVFSQTPPRIVITPAVEDGAGFVADRDALGVLYLTPVRVQAFEENNGQTNTSTVRVESEGLFLVQRPDAAAYLAESS